MAELFSVPRHELPCHGNFCRMNIGLHLAPASASGRRTKGVSRKPDLPGLALQAVARPACSSCFVTTFRW